MVERRRAPGSKLLNQGVNILSQSAWCQVGAGDRLIPRLIVTSQRTRNYNLLSRRFIVGGRAVKSLGICGRGSAKRPRAITESSRVPIQTAARWNRKPSKIVRVSGPPVYPIQKRPTAQYHAVVTQRP